MRRVRVSVLAASLAVSLAFFGGLGPQMAAPPASAQGESGQGSVSMGRLGHMFFRFTTPRGVVVMTSPWRLNPDSPITLE